MAAPFSFAMSGGGFTMGSVAGTGPAAAAASTVTGPASTIVPPCRPDAFPAVLHSPTLPPCPLLFATPAVHPLRGRVLVSTRAFAPGEVVLHEHAFLHSNWDAFRCADCDKPHMTRSCAGAKKKWSKKQLLKMDSIEGSLQEATCIGELDHARSFIKLLQMYLAESTLGVSSNGSQLADFFSLSYTHFPEALAGLTSKLPYQTASAKDILEDAGLWPSGLTVEDAARMLAILNTNSHELSEVRGTGVFLRASLMEHSCMPNCNFSTTGRELQILALRPIAAGENLSIDYGMGMYRPVATRREGLKRSHGFTCFCEACTSHPDRARAFTCPNGAGGRPCAGVVYPIGVDDREQEMKDWAALVAEASAEIAAAAPSPLPQQPSSTAYPAPLAGSWCCNLCKHALTPAQVTQALAHEKDAAKKLKGYHDEEEDEEDGPTKFDFDKHGDSEDEEDMDEEEDDDEGDEIRPPGELVAKLTALPAPALHPTHHLLFWSLEFYARSASADSDFAADAIPIFQGLLANLRAFVAPLGQELHDSLMIYSDYLAQVLVVTGAIDEARAAFQQAWKYCCALNGATHHSSLDLKALVDDTPASAEELQMKYAQFQEAMEALMYDTQVAKKKKKKAAGGKKKGAGKARDADSDAEPEDDDNEAGSEVAVNRSTQMAIMQQMEEMMLSKGQDTEGDAAMQDGAPAQQKKKKKKANKKK